MVSPLPQLISPHKTLNPVDAASRAIRDYCGWHVAPVITQTLTLDGSGGRKLFLPTMHLTAVDDLRVEGELVEGFRFSEAGWIALHGGVFPDFERSVQVTITHGFDYSDAVAQVVNGVVARARMAPTGNVVSQRAGTQSVTFATSGGEVTGFGLLRSEKELLAPYRLEWGPR